MLECDEFTHCVVDDDGESSCAPNTCEELDCDEDTERCIETDEGAYCRDLTCEADVECEPAEYCDDDGVCAEQACEPGARRCDGATLIACDPRGAEETEMFTCGTTGSYFESECVTDPSTTCTCEDDWDCPPDMNCELGVCLGTGVPAACSLPPADFSADDTNIEISWGGVSDDDRAAVDAPYPSSAQAQVTPIVANLDDDNGDGFIDELDIPEIIFLTFGNAGTGGTAGTFQADGILRAIHGGPLVRTEVHDGGCIFLAHDRRGCAIHRASIESGWPFQGIKPAICRLFPLSYGEDWIVIAPSFATDKAVALPSPLLDALTSAIFDLICKSMFFPPKNNLSILIPHFLVIQNISLSLTLQ